MHRTTFHFHPFADSARFDGLVNECKRLAGPDADIDAGFFDSGTDEPYISVVTGTVDPIDNLVDLLFVIFNSENFDQYEHF